LGDEVDLLIDNPAKTKACPDALNRGKLGCEANTNLHELVKKMIITDLKNNL